MINIIKNNFYRTLSKKNYIIISIIMTAVSIFLAVYFTAKLEVKGNIAVVTQNQEVAFRSKYINVTTLKKVPPKSQLVSNKYDAVVIDKGNGSYDIQTIKSDDFKKMISNALKNPKTFKPQIKDTRGVGTNIMGYLLMFLMMQGILFMFTFAEDRECKQIRRISVSPISFSKYLWGHFLFTFLFIFVPAFAILFILKVIFGFNIGFSLLQYLILLTIICAFSTAFSMFVNSLTEISDTANMAGSAIVTLTTILAGSFYSFDKANKIFDKAIWMLPQKDFISFVQGLENGKSVYSMLPQISYVIVLTLVFMVFSIIKNKRDYIQHFS